MDFLDFLVDPVSFWVGFLTALFFWWAWSQSAPVFSIVREAVNQRVEAVREGLSSSSELRFRQDTLKILQTRHITSPLFSLDEIAIPARVLLPPIPITPDAEFFPYYDSIQQTLPYLPDYPEMAAVYQVPTFSLAEAMSGGADLLLIGKAGAGKTFALSHLAIQMARRDPAVGPLSQFVPIYIDAPQLELPPGGDDLVGVIYKLYAEQVSTMTEAQLPQLFEALLTEKLAVLILDGLDEITPKEQKPVIEFIQKLRTKYPDNQLIAAASVDDISAMEPLGLQPIAISAWNEDQILAYIDRWSDLWHEYTLNESWARRLNPAIDPLLIKGWLLEDAHQLSPLLLSLKTWAAFAGDARGAKPADALDAYVRRMTTGIANARGALEQLAVQMTLTQNGIVERNLAGKYVSTFEDPTAPDEVQPAVATLAAPVEGLEDFAAELDALLGDDLVAELNTPKTNPFKAEEMDALLSEMEQGDKKGKESVTDQNVRRMLPELVRSNLLVYRPNGRISFSHPMLLGYLAGCGFAQRGGAAQLLPHPYWSGKTQALEYFAVSGNISEIVGPIFDAGEADPLKRALLIAANWPRNAAPNAAWRADVLRGLARYLTQEELSIAMRARLVTALATSGEATIGALFRRLLTLPATDARLLGALGCGLARYEKAVPELTNMLYAPDQFGGRAACMALVAIGSTAALEAVTSALLSAEDSVRQAAAEALANNPTEGYAVLRDGVKVTDLLVRRAVTFGLARVNQPWARELLDELHLNDDQWAVRSAAEQAISSLEDNDDLVPSPRPEIFTLPWLIKFAGEQGQGLAAGDGAWTTLKNVLRNGDSDQILNALDVIRLHPQRARDSIAPLYTLLRSGNPELREAAFETIWHLGSSGIDLPDPNQMLN